MTHPTDLVERRYQVLRVTASAVNYDHFIPYGLHIVTGAEKLAKTLAGYAELLLYATLESYVDRCLLLLELFSKSWNLHKVVRGLEILANGLCCGYCWCSHGMWQCLGQDGRNAMLLFLGPASLYFTSVVMRGTIRRALCVPRGSPQVLQRHFSHSKTNAAGHEDCDVVVVGGGPAGLALASALGAYPLDISNSSSIITLH